MIMMIPGPIASLLASACLAGVLAGLPQGGNEKTMDEDPPRISSEDLLASVRGIAAESFLAASPDDRSRALMSGYYESVKDWGRVLEDRMEPVPEHPGWAFYGRGGNREDDVRPIAYAAMVNAFLANTPPRLVPSIRQ